MSTTIPRPESFLPSATPVQEEVDIALAALLDVLEDASKTPQVVSWPERPGGAYVSLASLEAAMAEVRKAGWKVSFSQDRRAVTVLLVSLLTVRWGVGPKAMDPAHTDIRVERAA